MTREIPVGAQRWRHLLFLHWPIDLVALRPLVPEGLEIDTFEGQAYVGLIPFAMHDVRPLRWLPPVPTAAAFPEANVRTYVRRGDAAGVFFFSLDAGSALAVLGARASVFLPYYRAEMRVDADGPTVRYRSRRVSFGPRPAELEASCTVGAAQGPAAPGTLAHFLVERYRLFSVAPTGHLLETSVRHAPYPLHAVKVDHVDQSLTTAAGLRHGAERAPDLYSPGVDVDVLLPRPLGKAR